MYTWEHRQTLSRDRVQVVSLLPENPRGRMQDIQEASLATLNIVLAQFLRSSREF